MKIQYFYDILIKTTLGETLLIKAVKSENIYLVEYLLTAGSEIYSKDIYGKSAMDYAIELGNESIVSILKENTEKWT